jgi:predicted transcriptional regulator
MPWTEYEQDRLTDLVFSSNLSTLEIARELDRTELEVTKEIRNLGLSWVRRKKGHVSRGQGALTAIMQKLLPGEEIRTEEPIGDRLRLDVYCPRYQLAAEYHGRQHFFYTEHFHGNIQGFYESQARDEKKIEICRDLGIALVIFRYNDTLSEDVVYERMLDALRNTPIVEKEKDNVPTYKGNPFYEASKIRQREYRKQQYQKMKARRGRG